MVLLELQQRLLLQLVSLGLSQNLLSGTLPSSWSGIAQASHA